jgi:response regulator RpfG family c-di-GMP phosphodiesterase
VRIVGGREFDRIIVDVRMPGKDGPEFFDDLDGVAPAMRDRTIFMTGGFLESSTEDFIEETGRPSIKKPFDLAEMARTVEG